MIDLGHWTEVAVDAARQAGALIASYLGNDLEVSHKGQGSLAGQVVTEIDHLAQALILKILGDHPFGSLAEECRDDHSRFERPYFWCIDPIDGTLPFIEGGPGCSTSIALVSQAGEPLIGVVMDPCTGTLYQATAGQGARRNGEPWQFTADSSLLTIICDRSFLTAPDHDSAMQQFADFATKLGYDGLELIAHGGAVMNALWVLERAPAIYHKEPRVGESGGSIWDYAATACLFREVGGVCTDAFGEPLALNRLESTYLNHRGLLYASHHKLAELLWKEP